MKIKITWEHEMLLRLIEHVEECCSSYSDAIDVLHGIGFTDEDLKRLGFDYLFVIDTYEE